MTKEFKNKCAKYFWSNCMVGDKIDWDSVDGSNDFSVIPRLKNGCIKDFEVGEFRTIIDDIVEATATRTRQEDIRVLESIKKGGECYRFDKDRYALKCTCNNCYHLNEAIQKLKSLNK